MLARILPRHLCGFLSWHRVFALAPRLTSAPRAACALPSFTAYAEDPAPDNVHSARRRTIPLLSVSISSLPRRISVFTYTAHPPRRRSLRPSDLGALSRLVVAVLDLGKED
ncbi:hypothetical protein B0H14DRAFT_3428845 [Mycena olivaceomarginata]|nr:hypothetical protein B0H14DRAFT_3428845 [Mycena olivaceomarginata]